MACPICFFRDRFQRELKQETFALDRFEHKLAKYQHYYVEGIKSLTSVSKCECYKDYESQQLIDWVDEFIDDLKANIEMISNTFNEINKCYYMYIINSQKSAINHLHKFIENNCLTDNYVHASEFVKILFRARVKGEYNEKDIKEYFHIPFSKRNFVGSQRFSISGLPMVYFGSSILTVEKELNSSSSELNFSAFLPCYSDIYNFKFFNLKNSLNDLVENNLPGLFDGEVEYPYSDSSSNSFKSKFKKELQTNILFHICTFPTEISNGFIPEYIIPQTLTATLKEYGFNGLTFPSTKCFNNLKNNHRFSKHHINLVVFTNYNMDEEHDVELLEKFSTYLYDDTSREKVTQESVLQTLKYTVELNKSSEINNTDYIYPLAYIELQIDYLKESMVDGVYYYDTPSGKIEIELYQQLVDDMYRKVRARVA